MIDLHCHMLPGIDDGAADLREALAMARLAYQDGVRTVVCTPHIFPGLYNNDSAAIEQAVGHFREALRDVGVDIQLSFGADAHLTADLLQRLQGGELPSLHGSRYFLLEPPHQTLPEGFEHSINRFLEAGYIPLITHPERLTWVGDYYQLWHRLTQRGAWIQLTAGSLTGRFGTTARYWGERLLDDGLVHVLASDGHGIQQRPPLLQEGIEAVARRLGDVEAQRQVLLRPQGVLDNVEPESLPAPPGVGQSPGYLERFLEYCRQQLRGH